VRDDDRRHLAAFFDSDVARPTLGLVYGRRRIGKSTELVREVSARGGFYFEATRVASPMQLARLGAAIGEHVGVGRIALADWEEALDALLRIGSGSTLPVVLDEFSYILEADPSVASVIASALGPGSRRRSESRVRLVLCGSAIAMMRELTAADAPLRGRAGLELVAQPDDFRSAAQHLPRPEDLDTALKCFAVIGGVVGYATDMVDFDLPRSAEDFDRWIAQRVLSPAATLHYEASTLLGEDPLTSGTGAPLYRGVLGAIANGSVTAGNIAQDIRRSVANLTPVLTRLIGAGFVVRHEDPLRKQRPLYALSDPFLQFNYAVIEPNGASLRDGGAAELWRARLRDVFASRVGGPVFEELARVWLRRFASQDTVGERDHIGPSSAKFGGRDHELDVVAAGPGEVPADRVVSAIAEAKSGELVDGHHLRRLEAARAAIGPRASAAKLLLFGTRFAPELLDQVSARPDVEIVELDRLYHGI